MSLIQNSYFSESSCLTRVDISVIFLVNRVPNGPRRKKSVNEDYFVCFHNSFFLFNANTFFAYCSRWCFDDIWNFVIFTPANQFERGCYISENPQTTRVSCNHNISENLVHNGPRRKQSANEDGWLFGDWLGVQQHPGKVSRNQIKNKPLRKVLNP